MTLSISYNVMRSEGRRRLSLHTSALPLLTSEDPLTTRDILVAPNTTQTLVIAKSAVLTFRDSLFVTLTKGNVALPETEMKGLLVLPFACTIALRNPEGSPTRRVVAIYS